MAAHETFQGPTLEAALGRAAERFRQPAENLRFELLGERRGFLGVGVRSVDVRVEVPTGPAASGSRPAQTEGRARRAVAVSHPRPVPPEIERSTPAGAVAAEREDDGDELAPPSGPDATAPRVGQLAAELVRVSGLDLRAEMVEHEDRIAIELAGADRELLLDRRGETLNAIQYLLNRMARKSLGTFKRIQVESEGFRSDRDEEIRTLAMEAADRVLRTGEEVRLPPLNPYERRIVHVTISRRAGVMTESEGDGFIKRVLVRSSSPARGRTGPSASPARGRRPRR